MRHNIIIISLIFILTTISGIFCYENDSVTDNDNPKKFNSKTIAYFYINGEYIPTYANSYGIGIGFASGNIIVFGMDFELSYVSFYSLSANGMGSKIFLYAGICPNALNTLSDFNLFLNVGGEADMFSFFKSSYKEMTENNTLPNLLILEPMGEFGIRLGRSILFGYAKYSFGDSEFSYGVKYASVLR